MGSPDESRSGFRRERLEKRVRRLSRLGSYGRPRSAANSRRSARLGRGVAVLGVRAGRRVAAAGAVVDRSRRITVCHGDLAGRGRAVVPHFAPPSALVGVARPARFRYRVRWDVNLSNCDSW